MGRYGPTTVPAAPELESFLAAGKAADGVVNLDQLQTLFTFKLDDFQAQAVEVLLQGRSVVVCAPTGVLRMIKRK
jgi:superfamily II RNA helicase